MRVRQDRVDTPRRGGRSGPCEEPGAAGGSDPSAGNATGEPEVDHHDATEHR